MKLTVPAGLNGNNMAKTLMQKNLRINSKISVYFKQICIFSTTELNDKTYYRFVDALIDLMTPKNILKTNKFYGWFEFIFYRNILTRKNAKSF